ncbi:PRC-barrel domain-containing protein [Geodermatophilus sp. URMC 63]
MLSERDLSAAIGSTAQGPDGEKIGTVESFFVDDRTGAPTWVAVSTGLFGTRHSIVPATQATFADGVLRVPVSKDVVRHAPAVGGDHLGPDEEAELRRHYGLGTGLGTGVDSGVGTGVDSGTDTGLGTGVPATGAGGPATGERPADDAYAARDDTARDDTARDDTARHSAARHSAARDDTATMGLAAPTTPIDPVAAPVPGTVPAAPAAGAAPAAAAPGRSTDGAMTRSEEQLRVGTEQVAATRVRVVKYVVTEEVQVTVPIRREEVRVEEVPLDAPDPGPGESLTPAGGAAVPGSPTGTGSGAGMGTGAGLPEEIVLHAERPVVTVEVVPVERVRLRTELVGGQERITEQLQREQIVVDQTPAQQPPGQQPPVQQGPGQQPPVQQGPRHQAPAPQDPTPQGSVPPTPTQRIR